MKTLFFSMIMMICTVADAATVNIGIVIPENLIGGNDSINNSTFPYHGGDGLKIAGYIVHTDTTLSFFKNAIKQVTGGENGDFIRIGDANIIDQKYALIQFEVDEEFAQKILSLGASGKPDHLKRVYMVFTADHYSKPDLELIRQHIETLDWEGYKILEWVKNATPRATVIDAL